MATDNGRVKALLPIPDSHEFKRLNPDALHPNFPLEKFYPPKPEQGEEELIATDPRYYISIASSRHHMRGDVDDHTLERVGVLGVILSITAPTGDKVYGNNVLHRAGQGGPQAGNKRIKVSGPPLNNSRIIVCGDAFDSSPLTFCIILPNKNAFIQALGNANLSSALGVGDAILVYEPSLCNKTLGATIPILSDFYCVVPLRSNLEYPQKPILMSSEANQQVHFIKEGCSVRFSLIKVLVGNDVPCVGNSCDRQNDNCKGCVGVNRERRNFVIQVMVHVLDQPQYDALKCYAPFKLRSYKFTQLLIQDCGGFQRLDFAIMNTHMYKIREAAKNIQNYVNAHGGWTVIGWHRRGIIKTGADDSPELSTETKGHCVRLEPSNLTKEMKDEIEKKKFKGF